MRPTLIAQTKVCSGPCALEKPISEFGIKRQNKDGINGECRRCAEIRRQRWRDADPERSRRAVAEAQQRWKLRNPDRVALHSRRGLLKRRYGLTIEGYEALVEAQKGVCKICGEPPSEGILAVDHCHETGIVRGLLCGPCNLGLGSFKDNIKNMKLAVAYLESSCLLS